MQTALTAEQFVSFAQIFSKSVKPKICKPAQTEAVKINIQHAATVTSLPYKALWKQQRRQKRSFNERKTRAWQTEIQIKGRLNPNAARKQSNRKHRQLNALLLQTLKMMISHCVLS